jgi:hypothetical protein
LTSQWFANWCLDAFDHLVASGWSVGGYVRYCDDFLLLGNDRHELRRLIPQVIRQLEGMRLRWYVERLQIRPCHWGVTFVGYRRTPNGRRLTNAAVRQFLRRSRELLEAFRQGRSSRTAVHQRLMSWLGHASQAHTRGLGQRLSRTWRWRRGQFHGFADERSAGMRTVSTRFA